MTIDRQGTDSGGRTYAAWSSPLEEEVPTEMLSILSQPHNRHILLALLEQDAPIRVDELTAHVAAASTTTNSTGRTENYENRYSES
ncbi:hypothetical protein [Haladaptatus sp. NG-SE-30]